MATELIRWCDAHMFTDERVPGAAHTVQVDGKNGTVDLCPDHAKTLLGPLVDLMVTPTKSGAGRPKAGGSVRCFLCADTLRGDRMSAHLRDAHQITVAGVYGTRCPVCLEVFVSAQGAATHAGRRHQATTMADLWQAVEDDGDPQGVVAERRAGAIRGDRPD